MTRVPTEFRYWENLPKVARLRGVAKRVLGFDPAPPEHVAQTFADMYYDADPLAEAFVREVYFKEGSARGRALLERALAEIARVRWSASVTRGSLMDVYSTRVALGAAFLDGKLDVEAYYRPALRFYTADIRSGFDHRAGAQVLAALARDWQLAFVGDVLLGRDLDALLLQLHLVWRPTFGADG